MDTFWAVLILDQTALVSFLHYNKGNITENLCHFLSTSFQIALLFWYPSFMYNLTRLSNQQTNDFREHNNVLKVCREESCKIKNTSKAQQKSFYRLSNTTTQETNAKRVAGILTLHMRTQTATAQFQHALQPGSVIYTFLRKLSNAGRNPCDTAALPLHCKVRRTCYFSP
jgi:hypothetical protein